MQRSEGGGRATILIQLPLYPALAHRFEQGHRLDIRHSRRIFARELQAPSRLENGPGVTTALHDGENPSAAHRPMPILIGTAMTRQENRLSRRRCVWGRDATASRPSGQQAANWFSRRRYRRKNPNAAAVHRRLNGGGGRNGARPGLAGPGRCPPPCARPAAPAGRRDSRRLPCTGIRAGEGRRAARARQARRAWREVGLRS